MKVLVTGGMGYKGSVLVPKLLSRGYQVRVVDTGWFGNYLPDHPNMVVNRCDIRDVVGMDFKPGSYQAIIHLAGIANDPCGELDSKLTWEVNVLATKRLADLAVKAGIKQFIFASSASVYGLKDNKPVTEEDSQEPVSDYNKTKMCAERVLLSYANDIAVQIVRPATVCGMSPRMRLDTMVNMLTMQALTKGAITAHCGEHGGNLMRPNAHIQDITDLYVWMLERPELTGCYNAGFENISAMDTAVKIAERVEAKINITEVKDKRSYAVDSSKLLNLGFKPKHSVSHAIEEIVDSHKHGFRETENMMNLHWMRKHGWVSG
jgi:nucleoside-diphosphate-sugar epimerase